MKIFLILVLCVLVSGCFMSHKEVEESENSCEAAGGSWYVYLNRDDRPLNISCKIGGIKYYRNKRGEWK